MLKRTPLYQIHQALGARLIDFGGWEMPVQYSGIIQEHQTVRSAAGIFDIAHMGEFEVSGAGAERFLNRALCNDASKLEPFHAQYTLMLNEKGGVVDDLYLYRLEPSRFLLIVNASRIEDDFAWLQGQLTRDNPADVQLTDRSSELAAMAVQGPKSAAIMDAVFTTAQSGPEGVGRPSQLSKNQAFQAEQSPEVWVARTGYTGEDGFEIVCNAEAAPGIWTKVMDMGAASGLKPAGLGARDTLRTEACLPLYGHELSESITPLEAGLKIFVAMNKTEIFTGKDALERQSTSGLTRRLAAFKALDRGAPPRSGYPIFAPGAAEPIGEVTSGAHSPSLGIGIGLGYVAPEHSKPGAELELDVRGRRLKVEVSKRPLYRSQT